MSRKWSAAFERKSISKRTRFKVFGRDRYTCQYCGREPPDVSLEIEHLVPVVAGGENDILNLLTACEDCNDGKTASFLPESQMILLTVRMVARHFGATPGAGETAELAHYASANHMTLTDVKFAASKAQKSASPDWETFVEILRETMLEVRDSHVRILSIEDVKRMYRNECMEVYQKVVESCS